MRPRSSAAAMASSMGVCVGPGHTLLQVTPLRATSRATVFANAISPPFAAE